MHLVLASASPARLSTLRRAGVHPPAIVSGVREEPVSGLDPFHLAGALAQLKAEAVASLPEIGAGALVLGCDSVLDLDSRALGKPGTPEVAARRWREMRGRSAVLHTGHCLIRAHDGALARATASTTVHFADAGDDESDACGPSGEPLHVAGAFTIDGLGGAFVERIEGDHHNVVGVSLPVVRGLVNHLGGQWTDLWQPTPT